MANLTQSATIKTKVEIAWNEPPPLSSDDPYNSDPFEVLWTDVSSKVLLSSPITVERGSGSDDDQPDASTCTLLLDNADGRFTLGSTFFGTDANGVGLVKLGRSIRVTSYWDTPSRNLWPRHKTNFGAVSNDLHDWVNQNLDYGDGFGGPVNRWFTDELSWTGTYSFRADQPTVTTTSADQIIMFSAGYDDVVPGATYTFSIYVNPANSSVPLKPKLQFRTLNPATGVITENGLTVSGTVVSSTFNVWQRVTVTGTAPANCAGVYTQVVLGYASATAVPSQRMFFDGAQLEQGASATVFVEGSPVDPMFTGYIEKMPISYPNGDTPVVSLLAVDAAKRLAKRTVRSYFQQTVLATQPEVYFPMDTESNDARPGNIGSDQSASISPQMSPGLLAVAAGNRTSKIDFGVNPDVPDLAQDFGKVVDFQPQSVTAGYYLQGTCAPTTFGTGAWGFSMMVHFPSPAPAVSYTIATFYQAHGRPAAYLVWSAGNNQLYMRTFKRYPYKNSDGSWEDQAFLTGAGTDPVGLGWRHLRFYCDAAGNMTFTYNDVDYTATGRTQGPLNISGFRLGGDPYKKGTDATLTGVGMGRFQMSHFAMWGSGAAGMPQDLDRDASNANAGQTSFSRIGQLARWAGYKTLLPPRSWPDTVLGEYRSSRRRRLAAGTVAGSVSSGEDIPIAGLSALDAMQKVAASEHGIVYVNRQNRVTVQDRHYSMARPPEFTLDAATGIIQELGYEVDTDNLVNEVILTRPGQSNATRITDDVSIATYGVVSLSVDEDYYSDISAQEIGQAILARRAYPQLRIGTITINGFENPALAAQLLRLDLGTRFSIINLPRGGPSTAELIIQKLQWSLGNGNWQVTFDTRPAEAGKVWRVATAKDQVDVTGATLASTTTNLNITTAAGAAAFDLKARYPVGSYVALMDANGRQVRIRVTGYTTTLGVTTGITFHRQMLLYNIVNGVGNFVSSTILTALPAATVGIANGDKIIIGRSDYTGGVIDESFYRDGLATRPYMPGFSELWSDPYTISSVSANGPGSQLILDRPAQQVGEPTVFVGDEILPVGKTWSSNIGQTLTAPVYITSPMRLWARDGQQLQENYTSLADAAQYTTFSVLGASKTDPNGMRAGY